MPPRGLDLADTFWVWYMALLRWQKNALQHSSTPDFLKWTRKMLFDIEKIQNRQFAQEYACSETQNDHASNQYRMQHDVVHNVPKCRIYNDSLLNMYESCM